MDILFLTMVFFYLLLILVVGIIPIFNKEINQNQPTPSIISVYDPG